MKKIILILVFAFYGQTAKAQIKSDSLRRPADQAEFNFETAQKKRKGLLSKKTKGKYRNGQAMHR